MSELQEKSKEFLNSIAKIKKLAHKSKKSQEFHIGMIMTIKTIMDNCQQNSNDENYCGMKTSDLTKILCITKPATSKMLNALEENGYIERCSNKNDRRVVYVRVTDEGKECLEEEIKKFNNFICKVIEKMGEDDTDNLIRLLGKLYDVIEEMQSEN